MVVDASTWALQAQSHDPRGRVAQQVLPLLLAEMPVCAPVLLGYELGQLFFVKQKDPSEALRWRLMRVRNLLSDVRLLESDWDRIGYVADRHGLSAYDAAYLELAERLDASLATEDKELLAAAAASLGAKRAMSLSALANHLS